MTNPLSRREFLQVSSAAAMAGAVPLGSWSSALAQSAAHGPFRGTICFFSKPVPQLNWRELAQQAKQAGFGGIDLTVRSQGHVLPERVTSDLPKAVETIRSEGLEVPMITTELHSAGDPTADAILQTASQLSIPFLKPGYYKYRPGNAIEERNRAGDQFRSLVELAAKHQIQVGNHNHTDCIGSYIWDILPVIGLLDPRWCGFFFDLAHASVDMGENGWKVAASIVIPRMKMMGAKDFTWKPRGPHRWHWEAVPIGQGIAPWREFLPILAQSDFHGPVSLQQEYEIPGVSDDQGIAVSRAAVPQVMAAAKRDLDALTSLIREAYGA
jgi:sugar phosphate isomerase/epimerase